MPAPRARAATRPPAARLSRRLAPIRKLAAVLDGTAPRVRLDRLPVEPPSGLERREAEDRMAELERELFDLQDLLWGARTTSVLMVLQGRDAAGKDGAIKHVFGGLNPRGVHVQSFGVPTPEELEHDFLWRVHLRAPRLGEIAIFNRSHYEDVLVARVRSLVPAPVWRPRFAHIADFERLLAEHGTLVLKFFLHIDRAEQEERLLDRERERRKAWKLNVEDWRDRERWDDYTRAYEDALSRTAAPHAPWIVVPSNSKWYRNLVVAEALAAALRPSREAWERVLEKAGARGRRELAAFRREQAGARPRRPRPAR